MKALILWLASVVNEIHDQLVIRFSVQMTDKALHFWVIGLIGMVFFFLAYLVFKWINQFKFKTTIIAFVYTFTLMVVLVFAIEIQQAITNRGNMEFADAAMGLWGFIVFFFLYSIVAGIIYSVVQAIKRLNVRKKETLLEQPRKRFRSKK